MYAMALSLAITTIACNRDDDKPTPTPKPNISITANDYELSPDKTTLITWKNTNITEINMEAHPELKNITYIGNEIFKNHNLNSIILPSKLETIGFGAFRNTKNLKEITLPASIKDIKDEAFAGSGLETLIINATTPPDLGNLSIPNTSIKKIYVPAGSENSYRINLAWTTYRIIIDPKK